MVATPYSKARGDVRTNGDNRGALHRDYRKTTEMLMYTNHGYVYFTGDRIFMTSLYHTVEKLNQPITCDKQFQDKTILKTRSYKFFLLAS